jgi:hypothetical protein
MAVKVIKVSNEQRQHKIKTILPTGIESHHKGIFISLPEEEKQDTIIYNLGCTDHEYKKAIEAMLSQIKARDGVSLSKGDIHD